MSEFVAVLDIHGNPLMPTKRHGWVRRALRDGKAKRVNNKLIFTIQLTYEPETHEIQPMSLGIDSGKHIGGSVSNERQEYFAFEVITRPEEIHSLMQERTGCRRARRSKLRSRPARFNNRTRKESWLAPSVQHQVDKHVQYAQKCKEIFPISEITVERGQFDMSKMLNPDIQGVDYQNGEEKGFDNTKAYVLWRDNHRCRQCGVKNTLLEVHHIQFRSQGGSDRHDNLVTLCKSCHNKVHRVKKPIKLKDSILNQKNKPMRFPTQMNVVGKFVVDKLNELYTDTNVEIKETYGYITKRAAQKTKTDKSHVNDARLISGHLKCKLVDSYMKIQLKRRHKRKLATYAPLPRNKKTGKSCGRRNEKAIETVNGFRKGDLVLYMGQKITITALRSSGYFGGFNQNTQKKIDGFSSKKCKLLKHGTRHIVEEVQRIPMRH